uniref:YY1 associated factor 2 n=1 Tax=Equus asinus TaxID=9793 RepID=A0A8C4NB32_EQUAS
MCGRAPPPGESRACPRAAGRRVAARRTPCGRRPLPRPSQTRREEARRRWWRRDSKEGGKLVSSSTASLGVRGTLRNRVGGGSSEEKKQAEYLAPGRRRNIVHRGVGPGQRSGPSLKEA